MQTIANFPDVATAEMARSMLEAESIYATIPDAEMAGLGWHIGTALGGVRLQVPPEYAQSAAVILERRNADTLQDRAEDLDAAEVCPCCKSPDIKPDDHRKLVALSMLFLPLLIIAIPVRLLSIGRYRCFTCGKVWRRTKQATG
jgi:hypothetical protein